MLKVKFVDYPEPSLINLTFKILREEFGEIQESDDPDFLFYSAFGYEHLKYDCVRICILGENLQPDFNVCDYAVGFSYMTFEDRYKRIPLYYFYIDDYMKARQKHLITDEEIKKKKKFCNFIYSNNYADTKREQFFELLSSYKTVDSGGRFKNNIGGPVEDKYEFQKNYKFSIAFENSSTSGYTTEKILQAFSACTIPIYWGNPNVAKDFNENAFINCHKYNSFEEVVDLVRKIDEDDELFTKYLREPIGSETKFPKDPLADYREFLINICKQDPQNAFRRNNVYWGQIYHKRIKLLVYVNTLIVIKQHCRQLKNYFTLFFAKLVVFIKKTGNP